MQAVMQQRFTLQPSLAAKRLFTTTCPSSAGAKPPVTLHGLSGKYAMALFTAASNKKSLEKVESDLKSLRSTMTSDRKITEFLRNPTLTTKQKDEGLAALLKTINGGQEVTKNFFALLSEHGRLSQTEDVLNGFVELMEAHRGETTVNITSAEPLEKDALSRLEKALKGSQMAQKGKGGLKVVNKVNKSILGGLIVEFGDKTIDLSVSNRVNKLNSMINESV